MVRSVRIVGARSHTPVVCCSVGEKYFVQSLLQNPQFSQCMAGLLQQQSGQLEQPSRLRLLRRDVARIETVLSKRAKETK